MGVSIFPAKSLNFAFKKKHISRKMEIRENQIIAYLWRLNIVEFVMVKDNT